MGNNVTNFATTVLDDQTTRIEFIGKYWYWWITSLIVAAAGIIMAPKRKDDNNNDNDNNDKPSYTIQWVSLGLILLGFFSLLVFSAFVALNNPRATAEIIFSS